MYRADREMCDLLNILDIGILGPYDKYKVGHDGRISIDRGARGMFGRLVRTLNHHCIGHGYCKQDLIVAMGAIVRRVVEMSSRLQKSYGDYSDLYTSMRKLLQRAVTHLSSVVICIQRSYKYTILESDYWMTELKNVSSLN